MTAVEWLHEMLKDSSREVFNGNIWEEAKEMEKQQMIMFAEDYSQGAHYEKTAENYYNEKYGK